MKTNQFRIFALCSLLALGWSAPGLGVKEYYAISRSVRAHGMGGAFYGLSDDEYAMFYNPAGLSLYEGGKDLMAGLALDGATSLTAAFKTLSGASGKSVANLVSELQEHAGKPFYVGVTPLFPFYVRKGFAMGLLLADTKADFVILGRDLDTSVDVTAIVDSGVFVSYATEIFSRFHLGATLKAVYRAGGNRTYSVLDLAQGSSIGGDLSTFGGAGGGVDFDLGAVYDIEGLPFGTRNRVSAVVNNGLASTLPMGRQNGTPPGLPRMLTIAAHTRLPGIFIFDRFDLVLDFAEFQIGGETNDALGARAGSLWKHINVGVEAPLTRWLFLRTGIHQGNFSAGVGLDARFIKVDLSTYAEELSYLPGRLTSRRVALRMVAGFGGSTTPVESATEVTVPPTGSSAKKETTPDGKATATPAVTPAADAKPVETPEKAPAKEEEKKPASEAKVEEKKAEEPKVESKPATPESKPAAEAPATDAKN